MDWHSGPTQAPPRQEYAHDTAPPHCPQASHVSTPVKPEHCVLPGVKTHADAHAQAPQVQLEQFCVPYVLHDRVAPLTQTPCPSQLPLVCHEPLASHVCVSVPQLPHGTGLV